jgi:hypothetical protein
MLWEARNSILIYQHFRRENRVVFEDRLVNELMSRMDACHIVVFRTKHVLFLLVAQSHHAQFSEKAYSSMAQDWTGHIDAVEYHRTEKRKQYGDFTVPELG